MIKLFRTPDAVLAVSGDEALALTGFSFDALFSSKEPDILVEEAMRHGHSIEVPALDQAFLPPLGSQEVWAAGVTYFRSRVARMEESGEAGADVFYDKVYAADRPEIFFKATAPRVRGHQEPVRVRADSTWSVPEPELTLALNTEGKVFGFTIGNDLSARDIEGENPLYLPQAKTYQGSCALGPCLVLGSSLPSHTAITLAIHRGGEIAFEGRTALDQLKRGFEELAGWLFRENEFPKGALLMTGTGIVPGSDFTLESGDRIVIGIEGIGELVNTVA
ncbi:MAG: 2-hydroxyhepta-2,4-diene-1,7-dioate isomerase [Verrucomicrobiaceae bacterium]|nr:MAG: 2-hydroxyhepta-2,4-diene-1,7-dioate isomerase [Verrucomicrobiaceae bacterium]